jgi:hypothetical protein
MTHVAIDEAAADRLASLGLTSEHLFRAALRADAEAKLCNDLDPPTLGGMSRFGKTTRFVREELLPSGWKYSNFGNFCRTIHPSGTFSIVVSSGDEGTGVWVPGQNPSTKYPKGETTARAVETNMQFALDLGEDFSLPQLPEVSEITWYLLYRVTLDELFLELSLPTAIDVGIISDWKERIILGSVPRQDDPPSVNREDPPNDDDGDYSVDVTMR